MYVPVLGCDSWHSIYFNRRLRSTFEFIRLLQPTSNTRTAYSSNTLAESAINSSHFSVFDVANGTNRITNWILSLNQTGIFGHLASLFANLHLDLFTFTKNRATISKLMNHHNSRNRIAYSCFLFHSSFTCEWWIKCLFHFDTHKSEFTPALSSLSWHLADLARNKVKRIIDSNEMANLKLHIFCCFSCFLAFEGEWIIPKTNQSHFRNLTNYRIRDNLIITHQNNTKAKRLCISFQNKFIFIE